MRDLTEEEQAVVALARQFVDEQVRPVIAPLERADIYPSDLIDQMKAMGVFGLLIPEPFGENRVSVRCFAGVTEELARGWMSLAGAMGGHSVVSVLIDRFGTDAQKDRYLPRLATGELRATMALTEPSGGSDLLGMSTNAERKGDHYVVNGAKTWITNAIHSDLIALLAWTDPAAEPNYRGISILLVEKGPGLTVSAPLPKLGYKGVESCEVVFDGYEAPDDAVLGGEEGRGFTQMMHGLEVGRIQVGARAVGVAQAALDEALRYAQEREAFGVPIWQHQAIGHYLADMATKLQAARLLVHHAAESFDSGGRSDMEAGMAKLFASEVCMEITDKAMRIHGGYGYSTEFPVERFFRDAPLMVIGEGTNEIQRNIIARQLVRRSPIDPVRTRR